ncbi:MAG: hypothetical protein LBS99_06110 [Clostridiales bacterium]|jgi:hypothetical protein|nr:hypothetical protein [Clostridiales bacterium]
MSESGSKKTVESGEPQQTPQKTSFADKLKGLPERFRSFEKKKKRTAAVIAGILILIIGLSLGLPLGLRSAGVVGARGWDRALDATAAELDKQNWNVTIKFTYMHKKGLSDGSIETFSSIGEIYVVGNKIKRINTNNEDPSIEMYYFFENGRFYYYGYDQAAEKWQRSGQGDAENFEAYKKNIKDWCVLSPLKGERGVFERKDGGYKPKDGNGEHVEEILKDMLVGADLFDFFISFKNGRLRDYSFYSKLTGDNNAYEETSYDFKYSFGKTKVTLPTDYVE